MSIWGQISTFGIASVLLQGYEKLVVDSRRFSQLQGEDMVPDSHSPLPLTPDTIVPDTAFLVVHSYFPNSQGGTEVFVRNLAKGLQNKGYRVFIFAYSAETTGCYDRCIGGIIYREEKVDDVPVIRFRHKKASFQLLKNFGADEAEEHFLKYFLQRYNPGLVHFAHLRYVGAMASACQSCGIPYIVTLTDFFPLCHYSTRIDRRGRICPGCQQGKRCKTVCPEKRVPDSEKRYEYAAKVLKGARGVIAPSCYVATVYEREIAGLSVTVIPHGILPTSLVERQGDVRRFVYIGNISESKGVFSLVDSFSALPEDCFLEIYGTGQSWSVKKLRRLCEKNPRMTYHGAVPHEQIGEVYRRAHCVVVPSLVPETYNFVVREALESGCLVVGSRIGAISEAITERQNGFLFDAGDRDSLRDALKKAYSFSWRSYFKTVNPTTQKELGTYISLYGIVKRKEKVCPK